MSEPPKYLEDALVLYHAKADPAYNQNPRFKKGVHHLAITTDDQRSFYLFYCDSAWQVLGNTQVNTIDDAMNRAKQDFPGMKVHWLKV